MTPGDLLAWAVILLGTAVVLAWSTYILWLVVDVYDLRKRAGLAVVRLFGRLGLIKVPYGDYQAAQGRRDPSGPTDQDTGGN